MEAVHTIEELRMKQALPLDVKVRMTKIRIREWINEWGEDGVYVSFSGGKDSTVLLNIVREDYPNVPAVFVDTGLEYPEIREFVKGFDNVTWLKPKMTFKQVINKYGYPFFSKEVSEVVQGARTYLTRLLNENTIVQTDRQTDRQTDSISYAYDYERLTRTGRYLPPPQTSTGEQREETHLQIRDRQIAWSLLRQTSMCRRAREFRRTTGIGEYSKRTEEQPRGREQSEVGTDVRTSYERSDDRSTNGKYP